MSKTQTETVETAYGSVDVELAECDSCGNRVRADKTVPFEIGDREGRACEHCRDEGPMSFPEEMGISASPSITFAVYCFLLPVAVAAVADAGDESDVKPDEKAALLGMAVGGGLWMCIALLAVFPTLQLAVFGALPF